MEMPTGLYGTPSPYIGPVMDSVLSGRLHVEEKRKRTDISLLSHARLPPFTLSPTSGRRDKVSKVGMEVHLTSVIALDGLIDCHF